MSSYDTPTCRCRHIWVAFLSGVVWLQYENPLAPSEPTEVSSKTHSHTEAPSTPLLSKTSRRQELAPHPVPASMKSVHTLVCLFQVVSHCWDIVINRRHHAAKVFEYLHLTEFFCPVRGTFPIHRLHTDSSTGMMYLLRVHILTRCRLVVSPQADHLPAHLHPALHEAEVLPNCVHTPSAVWAGWHRTRKILRSDVVG